MVGRTLWSAPRIPARELALPAAPALPHGIWKMKVANSLKTLKTRHRACRVVRRKGRVYVINKENPRFKARQG